MSILADSHVHTIYSYDAEVNHDDLCKKYIERGFSRIALTDHYDIDGMDDGLYPVTDIVKARKSFEEAQKKYGDKIDLVWGIELGQAPFRYERSKEFIKENKFEFVIGSIHNLEISPDFYYMNLKKMPEEMITRLYGQYLDALFGVASFEGVNTLAHCTYPLRYIHRDGRELNIEKFYPRYRELFHILIENGIALELNTSGLRKGYVTSPDTDLLELYRDCGGKLVTCGSDSHREDECGMDIDVSMKMLKKVGFTHLTIPSHGKPEQIPL